jgi:hypothetical protein
MANKEKSIPGIEGYDTSGLSDGRAKSSAFQMATPGSSPNKIFPLGAAAGMLGLGAERPKELLEGTGKTIEKVTGFKVSGGDEETDVAGGAGEDAVASIEENNAGVGGSALTMAVTSPVQQEGTFKFNEQNLRGGDMGEVKKDESGRMFITIQDGANKGTNVFISQPAAEQYNANVGSLLTGGDYTAKKNAEGEYELQLDMSDMYKDQQENVDEID